MRPVDGPRGEESAAFPLGEGSSGARRRQRNWTADLLDVESGRMGFPLLDRVGIRELLSQTRRIAIVGASPDPTRPSHGVLLDLQRLGYDVVPVNPAADDVAGLRCHPTLAAAVEATGPVDIVDVFRLPPACPGHAREAVEVGARCLWLQLGIASREAGEIAHAGGLSVVMNKCLAVEAMRG